MRARFETLNQTNSKFFYIHFTLEKRSLHAGCKGDLSMNVKIQSFMEIIQRKEKHRPENFARFVSPERAKLLVEAVSKQIDPVSKKRLDSSLSLKGIRCWVRWVLCFQR